MDATPVTSTPSPRRPRSGADCMISAANLEEIMRFGRAPLAKVRSRVRQGELDEDRAFAAAVEGHKGIDRLTPVIWQGKRLGWVRGESPRSPHVWWRRSRPEEYRCSITTYDALIAAFAANNATKAFFCKTNTTAFSVASNYYDLWPVAGTPAAGAINGTAFTATVPTDTTTGSLWHGGNVSSSIKNLVAAWANSSGGTPTIYFYDRCLVYDQCTFNANSNQALTNTNTLTRYQGNADGGCKVFFAVGPTLTGATAANLTQCRYTNQVGATLQAMPTATTVTFIPSVAASTSTLGARFIVPSTSGATVLWGPFIPMAAGDGGARLVNDYTTSAANTGNFTICLARPIAIVPCITAGSTAVFDLVEQVAGMEKILDTACLSAFVFVPATTATTLSAGMQFAWG